MADAHPILVVHQSSELYGSDRMVLQLLNVLSQSSQPVTLHVPYDGPLVEHAKSQVKCLVIAPISVLRLCDLKKLGWLNIFQIYRNASYAWRQLKQHHTVIINSCVIIGYLLLLPFYRGKKYVYVHEINTGLLKICFNILLWITRAQLICNSHATADCYPLISSTKKHVAYNNASLKTTPNKKHIQSTFNLLIIGRISPRKGHKILLEALHILPSDTRSRIHVRIVGNSFRGQMNFINELTADIHKFHLEDHVTFHPFTDDPAPHYQWADCVIVPSVKPESFGLVALEAMLYGCAVIASDTGALPEIVTHGQTGLIVRAGDVSSLARAIVYYDADRSIAIQHGQSGQRDAASRFSDQSYDDQMRKILHV